MPTKQLLALALAGTFVTPAAAQMTLEVSKITCEQYSLFKITDPDNIALWISGYYNGQKGNTLIEPQLFKANVKKLNDYCVLNPKVIVLRAVEIVLGTNK